MNKFPTPIVLDGGNKSARSLRMLRSFASSIAQLSSCSQLETDTILISHMKHKQTIWSMQTIIITINFQLLVSSFKLMSLKCLCATQNTTMFQHCDGWFQSRMCVNFRSDQVIAKIELFSVEIASYVQTNGEEEPSAQYWYILLSCLCSAFYYVNAIP